MRLLILLVIPFLFCCSKHKQPAAQTPPPVEVSVLEVHRADVPLVLEFVGEAQSSHPVDIFPRVEGYLEKIYFIEGAFVKQGDPLFDLDPNQFEIAVKEAQANLEREQANLASAEKAVNRYRPLYEQKAASQKDLDDAVSQLLGEQAAVALYQAKLDGAKLDLSYTHITSPISGLTGKAKYREGTLINPASSEPLTTISVLDPIWINLNISDFYFLQSYEEMARGELVVPADNKFDVTLTLADGSLFQHHGTVDFVSPILDPSTGTLNVRAVFPNPNYLIKPGQFVKLSAYGAVRPKAILIPQKAVIQGVDGLYVYVVKGNRTVKRPIEVGDWHDQDWFVKSGLENGDVIVVEGTNKVTDGTKVKIKQP